MGLTAAQADVVVVCRTLAATEPPDTGTKFRFKGKLYTVLNAREVWSNRQVRVMTVSGSRWDELGDGPAQVFDNDYPAPGNWAGAY